MVSPRILLRKGTICIEGNIGCGKTTLLDFFKKRYQATGDPDPGIFLEPVERWRNVDGENLFHYLYKDPARYSLAFQTYVQLTMIKLHSRQPKLMERSIYSARYCFVENLYKLNYLSRLEYIILDKWFKHLVLAGKDNHLLDLNSSTTTPPADNQDNYTPAIDGAKHDDTLEYNLLSKPTGINVDLIIYLRCTPEKVMNRIKLRSRAEEKDISFEYVKSLHDLHEDWLMNKKFPVPAPVLILDTNCKQSSLEELYEKAAPYINGEKKITSSPKIISIDEMMNGIIRN